MHWCWYRFLLNQGSTASIGSGTGPDGDGIGLIWMGLGVTHPLKGLIGNRLAGDSLCTETANSCWATLNASGVSYPRPSTRPLHHYRLVFNVSAFHADFQSLLVASWQFSEVGILQNISRTERVCNMPSWNQNCCRQVWGPVKSSHFFPLQISNTSFPFLLDLFLPESPRGKMLVFFKIAALQ